MTIMNDRAVPSQATGASAKDDVLVIEAGRPDGTYWLDMWRSRELMYILARRDVVVRYRQTVIGFLWTLIRPALNVLIFTLVFGIMARLPSQDGVPYPVLVLSGLMPWMLVSTLLNDMSNSLLNNAAMVSKIYFPRLLVPLSTIPVNLFDIAITLMMMVLMMLYYGFVPSWQIVFLPLCVVMAVVIASGAGLMFAALNVPYRDVRYIVPFALSAGWLLSPVGYSPDIVPEHLRFLFALNPMVSLIEAFRWSILGRGASINMLGATLSMVACFVLLIIGYKVFRSFERAFADVI